MNTLLEDARLLEAGAAAEVRVLPAFLDRPGAELLLAYRAREVCVVEDVAHDFHGQITLRRVGAGAPNVIVEGILGSWALRRQCAWQQRAVGSRGRHVVVVSLRWRSVKFAVAEFGSRARHQRRIGRAHAAITRCCYSCRTQYGRIVFRSRATTLRICPIVSASQTWEARRELTGLPSHNGWGTKGTIIDGWSRYVTHGGLSCCLLVSYIPLAELFASPW